MPTQYMIVERFKNKDAKPVYERFREKGRMAPEGLVYLSSWIDESLTTCWQLMETDDPALIDQWIENWKDLTDFEVVKVITSKAAAERVLG